MSVTTTDPTNPTAGQPAARSPLSPRRTLNRLAVAAAAVALALTGQSFFSRQSLWDGLLFYVAAAVLFALAVGPQIYPGYNLTLPNPRLAGLLAVNAGWRRNFGIWTMTLAVATSGLGYVFFGHEENHVQAWLLYLSSLGLFVSGGLLLTPDRPLLAEARRVLPSRRIAAGLAVVLGLALFLRLYNFTGQPYGVWFDEAEAGLQARQIIQNADYRPIFYPAINVSGQFLWLYAQALRWLSDSIYALRLVSVLFGLGGVLAAYLFGQELRGPRFGLALAFFTAVARWHVNFSRIAMTGVDTLFFQFLSLYFLTRLLRRGHLRDAIWAGLTLGMGLNFYTAFRLYLLALAIFAVLALIRWSKPLARALGQGGWPRVLAAAAMLLISGWLAVMPMVRFALDNPADFMYRTRQISILTKRDQADLTQALLDSTYKHLLMFNVSGDKNGRHNLPGEPMLDPLMGALLILGLGLALARTRHPANLFFLVLLPVALLGGIFSVDFEAPQSLRSIAVLPAVVYFCGLCAAAVGREAESALAPLPRGWVLAPAALLAGYMFTTNAYTYLVLQANDFASWNAFSAPETITGRKMAQLGPNIAYYLSPFLTNHPATHFLAPAITNQLYLNLPDALPSRDSSGQPVALFIHPDDEWVYTEAHRMYPNAQFETLRGPAAAGETEGPASVYFVLLQPGDLQAVRGLDLRYLPPVGVSAAPGAQLLTPLGTSRAYGINVTWPQDGPPAGGDFMAEWNGVLYAPVFGPYRLRLVTPGPGQLEIDGNKLLNGQGEQTVTPVLAQGNHSLRVTANSAPGPVALYWQPPNQTEEPVPNWALYALPVTNHGLLGTFYPNDSWAGPPALQRIDPFLDTYFHLLPLQRPYSVEWSGQLVAPQTGMYQLGLRAVPAAELFLDGASLIRTAAPDITAEAGLKLDAGLHELRIKYRDTVDRSRIHLTWTPPNGQTEAIPREFLWPPLGSYPVAAAPPPAPANIALLKLDHVATLGLPGSDPGQFIEPRDVAVLTNGNLVVADTGNRRVQIFSPQYVFLKQLTGSDDLPFEEPLAVEVLRRASGDEILVLDSAQQWIFRFDGVGNYLNRFGGPAARLFHPRGLAVFPDSAIGVANTGMSQLALFKPDGDPLGVIGSAPGAAPGQFNEPTDALKDEFGTYFVAEAENNRIQRLDNAGNPLGQWNISPAFAFNGPHLAFGPDSSIFMTEAQSQSLYRFTSEGELLEQWRAIGPVNLVQPVGIYFDRAGSRLYLTDVGAHQVDVFEVITEN